MSILYEQVRAARDIVRAEISRRFPSLLIKGAGITKIGDDFAVLLYIGNPFDAKTLPKTVNGIPVTFDSMIGASAGSSLS